MDFPKHMDFPSPNTLCIKNKIRIFFVNINPSPNTPRVQPRYIAQNQNLPTTYKQSLCTSLSRTKIPISLSLCKNPPPCAMIIPPDSVFPSGSQSAIFIPPQYSYNFTHQIPYPSNPTNPIWSFPQPVVPSAVAAADPACHPPGTDPYDNSGLFPWTRVGFQGQTPFGEDPNVRPQNWVGKQAEPVRYEASIKSLNESMSVPSLASNSSWNSSWTNQPLANAATMNTPQPTVVVQSLRCDVCDIYCTSKPIYEAHIAGKKHQKKVAMQHNPSVAAGAELETKRRKILRGGSTVDSVRVCTICNITCNSEEVYNKHLYGKRHKAQASLMALDGGPYIAAVRSQFNGIWKKDPNKAKLVQSAWCEVCKINCNSNDAYVAHLVGKKHKKNLEQLGKSKNDGSASTSNAPSAATNAIIGPTKNPGAESSRASQPQVPKEDLETKKKKVISGGATASAVRTCTVCNVVCNSHTVFSSHLAGQKHTAMVKKQAEASSN